MQSPPWYVISRCVMTTFNSNWTDKGITTWDGLYVTLDFRKYIIVCGGKQWQTAPKNLPRMQRTRAIPVDWLSSGLCPNRPKGWIPIIIIIIIVCRFQWPRGLGLWPLACWDCGFESHPGHGYLSVVSVVCCQVEVSATDWSFIQRSPTECGASLCVIKKPRKRGG